MKKRSGPLPPILGKGAAHKVRRWYEEDGWNGDLEMDGRACPECGGEGIVRELIEVDWWQEEAWREVPCPECNAGGSQTEDE